jgi:hypothetical protein
MCGEAGDKAAGQTTKDGGPPYGVRPNGLLYMNCGAVVRISEKFVK